VTIAHLDPFADADAFLLEIEGFGVAGARVPVMSQVPALRTRRRASSGSVMRRAEDGIDRLRDSQTQSRELRRR
jgi:hypothetical protein